MAQLGNLLVKGSSRFLNKAYFEDISIAGTSFFSGNISTDGTLNIGANKASNALLYLNNKIAVRAVDSWLRINDTSTNFTSGVYFGNSDVRTDKEFQVGDGGKYFKINSSSLNVNVSSVFSQRTTHNGGLISPTISSNLISFVKNGNTLPKIDGADVTAVLNELTVLSTLRAKEYELDHVQNLGGTFMVSPSFICTEGSTSVTVSAISGSEVTFVIKDNATLTKTEIATASWVLNSQIKLSGKIGNAILANATGTITKSVDTNNHTITVKVDVGSSTVGNFTVNTTYSGSQVSKLALMMIRNASGYRLGIYLESYSSENKKPVINIFDGSDTNPKVVLGKLDGTPKINNISPTGYGLYSDNAFLKGTIIATSGTIGGFTLSTNSIQNGTFGQDGSVMMSLGSNNSASIGDSGNINGWTFTAGSKFGVTKNGAMYATSGKIGGFNIDSTYLQSSDKTVGLSASASDWAFWAGGADISTAKFRVNHAGQLWATSADISGKITATSGKIGGCSIKDNVLQIANVNINSISAEKITSGTLDSDRIGANSITAEKITTDILKSKNYVSETSGSFLNLADGSFDSKYLKWDNVGKVIANDITVVGGSINVNDKFIVNNDGVATLQGATVVGNITAESGKIGKFNLDNLALVTGDTDVTCAGLGGSSQAFWAGSLIMDNAPFRVGYDGKLYASDADIAGEITATSGKIGKYRIDDYLITGSGSTCTGMGGNQAFWAGSNSSNDAPFHVSYDGSLYASKANISGVINSTDGSIGGWKIENSSIYVRSIDGLKQTSLNSDSQKIEFKLTKPASTESDESSSFLNISNSNLSPYIELGWMTTDFDGNAYWGNRTYISEDSIAISSKADIDSSVTISSNDIILSDTGDKLTISPGYLQFENGVSISPNQDILWSGAEYMNENQKISLDGDKNISKQLSGICLAFTYFDRSNNSVKWYGMHYYFVPKSAVAVNNGGGTAFTDAYRGINKYLYIYDDKILGTKQNGTNGSEGGFSYDNRNWVLVKVFGV